MKQTVVEWHFFKNQDLHFPLLENLHRSDRNEIVMIVDEELHRKSWRNIPRYLIGQRTDYYMDIEIIITRI